MITHLICKTCLLIVDLTKCRGPGPGKEWICPNCQGELEPYKIENEKSLEVPSTFPIHPYCQSTRVSAKHIQDLLESNLLDRWVSLSERETENQHNRYTAHLSLFGFSKTMAVRVIRQQISLMVLTYAQGEDVDLVFKLCRSDGLDLYYDLDLDNSDLRIKN